MAKPAHIYTDAVSRTIFFNGTSVKEQPLGKVVAIIHPEEADRIKIFSTEKTQVNDDGSTGNRIFLARFKASRVVNENDESLIDDLGFSTIEVVDQLNQIFQLSTDLTPVTTDGSQIIDFSKDELDETIIIDNGSYYPHNVLLAVGDSETNKINLVNKYNTEIVFFENIPMESVTIKGNAVANDLNTVVNQLNQLFSRLPEGLTGEASTPVVDIVGVDTTINKTSYVIDPIGDAIAAGSGSHYHRQNLYTTETLNDAGEYYTFSIKGEGIIGMGLYDADSNDISELENESLGSSGNYGFLLSNWFHPTPDGPWQNYGSNTSFTYLTGWSSSTNGFRYNAGWQNGDVVNMKVGINADSFLQVEYWNPNSNEWVPIMRSSYKLVENTNGYGLAIKFADTNAALYSLPKIHSIEDPEPEIIPTWYSLEYTEGLWNYPLFKTEEEAIYVDEQYGTAGAGNGSATTHVFPNDPTGQIWYLPDTLGYTSDPVEPQNKESDPAHILNNVTFNNVQVILPPPAFTDQTITVNEGDAVNFQVSPIDVSYTTTIGGIPDFQLVGNEIQGTAPQVDGDNVSNPSDTTTITVYRTSGGQTTQGTLTIVINNLTAPVDAITGFSHENHTTPMIDSDTMDDGSVVKVNSTIADNERFVIEKAYIETNILPSLQGAGDQYIIGLKATTGDFATVELSDFEAAIAWEYIDANSHKFTFYEDGVLKQTVVINSATSAFYDYAIELDGTDVWLIACNINNIMNEPSPADGGNFSNVYKVSNISTTPLEVYMTVLGTQGDISTSDIETVSVPDPSARLTSFNKAVDFSGSNEHAQQVSNHSATSPLMMSQYAVTQTNTNGAGKTASGAARPWGLSCVFKADGHNSNEHIWNMGEGAGDTDDNIYLRLSSSNGLFFGWGRPGATNECYLGNLNTSLWYGFSVVHTGERLSANNATTSNLAACFDIRLTSNYYVNNFTILGSNKSTQNNWTSGSSGARMDRGFSGYMTVGGRGSNRSFHGKVASMVVTTFKQNQDMPTDAELMMMITDPVKWVQDYKIGQSYRRCNSGTNTANFSFNDFYSSLSTQVWLMGDGVNDSYSNMIRNYISTNEQNYGKLNLISMVSNDIQNVNITGLS